VQKQQIQFSKLHQERAEVIKEMHGKLIELQSGMVELRMYLARNIDKIEEEAEQKCFMRANEAIWEFNNYVLNNGIFFEKQMFEKLTSIRFKYIKAGWKYKFFRKNRQRYVAQEWDLLISIEYDFPPLIEQLEEEFRELLGVKSK
jgi:hypothetical protein